MGATDFEFPRKILIVEDDRTIRAMLQRTFSEVSEVLEAEDGRTALEVMRAERPDFVITDLMIPELSGAEMIEHVRRTYWGVTVPILVLTANTREQVLLDCFHLGADDFMVKPFSLQEVRVRVASIYVRQRVARDVNPLTGIPGNITIKREVERRLEEGVEFAVAILDLDHFKAFNDSRGFDAGDDVIRGLGDILEDYADQVTHEATFIGHVGGDDFLALVPPEEVPAFADFVHTRFADAVRRYYERDELETGTVDIVNRHGEKERVPLLSVSIGAVDSRRPGLTDFRHIAQIATEVKKVAKREAGNSLFVDRRRSS